jgi:hypothetical protein
VVLVEESQDLTGLVGIEALEGHVVIDQDIALDGKGAKDSFIVSSSCHYRSEE